MKLILAAVLLIIAKNSFASKEIGCESFKNGSWTFEGRDHICYMTVKTSINSNDVKIVPNGDEMITALTFFENRKIHYLPVDIFKSFPNLTEILGHSCSIRSLYKSSFRSLRNLKELWLVDNQIEKINSDTFEDLTALEWLDLSMNFSK
jgi:Leucine rich repeat